MICEQCKKEGLTSKIYLGMSYITMMYCPPFYDEVGKYHNHDLNHTTSDCVCSNGHKWKVTSQEKWICGCDEKEE